MKYNINRSVVEVEVIGVYLDTFHVHGWQWRHLFAQISFRNTTLSISIMSFEKVCDVFSRYRQILLIALFKEREVVFERAVALKVFVNCSVQVIQIDLAYLILSSVFKLILEPDYVIEKLAEFLTCSLSQAHVGIKIIADITLSHSPINEVLEARFPRLDQLQEVCVAHFSDSVAWIYRELSL